MPHLGCTLGRALLYILVSLTFSAFQVSDVHRRDYTVCVIAPKPHVSDRLSEAHSPLCRWPAYVPWSKRGYSSILPWAWSVDYKILVCIAD